MGLAEGMVQSEELALSNIATKNYKNHKRSLKITRMRMQSACNTPCKFRVDMISNGCIIGHTSQRNEPA